MRRGDLVRFMPFIGSQEIGIVIDVRVVGKYRKEEIYRVLFDRRGVCDCTVYELCKVDGE